MFRQVLWLTIAGGLCAGAETPRTPALEGLDPVRLTEGQDVPGKATIALEQGRFLYQFSSEATRDRFRREPERYGIQLDGACARMGPPVGASADAYFVYDHRIYIFGSRECYKRFSANPAKYLESAQPKPDWDPTATTRERGKAVLEKVIEATGGATQWAGIRSYAEVRRAHAPAGDRSIRIAARLPDSLITETSAGANTFGSLVTPAGAWEIFRGEGRRIPESFAQAILADARRDLLPLLLDCHTAGFAVYYAGRSGDADRLQIRDQGRISTMLVDPSSGRPRALAWLGRTPDGFATIHTAYSDYRPAGGLQLPFRAERSAEKAGGGLEPDRSWTVESYEFNPTDIEARLQPPAKVRE